MRFRWLWLFAAAIAAYGHNPSTSFIHVQVDRTGVIVRLSLNWWELPFSAELDANGNRQVDAGELNPRMPRLEQFAANGVQVLSPSGPLPLRLEKVDAVAAGGHLEFTWRAALPRDRHGLRLHSALPQRMGPAHISLVKISAGTNIREAVLDAARPEAAFDAPGLAAQAGGFLWLGVRHIFTGYDHLLFLIALLLAGGRTLELVKIVTAFTIAHSITLALATLGAISLPPRFVESAIALSICYVAAENILFATVAYRWLITFLFGLVHGFGFSAVLRELELPRSGVAASLLFFNLGVEAGQVAIVLLLLPALALLARSAARRRITVALSAGILLAGLYWFVQRTFL